jgi:iron complex transport system substrate-binding protein
MTPRTSLRRSAALATAAAAALALTACGGSSAASGDTTELAASDTSYPRTIEHHKGSTEVPAKPQRIVALDNSLVEAVVLLERPLVGGISSYRDLTGFPPYLGEAVAETEEVGPLETPDLEAVAALEPDLIVSATVRHDALYDELSAIAPTVFVETTGPIWRENITFLGEVLGEEDQAAEVLDDYRTRAKALGEAINDKAGDPTISVVRFLDGPTRLYQKSSFSGHILADMGLARPASQDVEDFAAEIGEEQIRQADGDHIFVTSYSGGEASKERFVRNPLWGQLEGVKAGNVHEVEDAIWMTSVSVQGAHLVMDDLAEVFGVDDFRS